MNLPAGPFDVIVADPPWRFASNSAARPGRNAMRHYPTMTVPEVMEMPVRDIAAPAALLLLWITVPHAHRADEVIRAWGFTPKSQVVWIKNRIGTGYWARNRHELLHLATRGRFPCPRPALFADSVITGQQREHSRKPDAVFDAIDTRLGGLRRLELFSRQARPGWTAWGNEIDKFQEAG
ncbi:MAG: DNA methyltransferase [Rhodobacteraceae bacterium]|nr:DNA methyltransferase [Paracoccaceae bacterium]